MVLLVDEARVEARFGPFGDCANPDARQVHGFMLTVPYAWKSFWTNPIGLLGDVGHVEFHLGPFGDSVVSMQDRRTVCAKCTIGSEIILDAPDGTPR